MRRELTFKALLSFSTVTLVQAKDQIFKRKQPEPVVWSWAKKYGWYPPLHEESVSTKKNRVGLTLSGRFFSSPNSGKSCCGGKQLANLRTKNSKRGGDPLTDGWVWWLDKRGGPKRESLNLSVRNGSIKNDFPVWGEIPARVSRGRPSSRAGFRIGKKKVDF